MAESMSQPNFYGDQDMHYLASQATMGNPDEDLFHVAHLQLQEQMRNPIMFHAKMMGDIMYLQQVLNSLMQRNLSKQSSRKSMDMWTPTTGHSGSKAKLLRMSK
jgi:hypothetical protein